MKLKGFCKSKDTVNWTKVEWAKIFSNSTSVRELIPKIYKEAKKFDIKDPNNTFYGHYGTPMKRKLLII